MTERIVGIIGGSGLYEMDGLEILREEQVRTPFGDPSDQYVVGRLEGRPVAFLARHGRSHSLMPSELNFRANVYGFKVLGAEWILTTEKDAVRLDGSLPAGFPVLALGIALELIDGGWELERLLGISLHGVERG